MPFLVRSVKTVAVPDDKDIGRRTAHDEGVNRIKRSEIWGVLKIASRGIEQEKNKAGRRYVKRGVRLVC
jgi:hypothetical protein